jgi:outer membrane lipoprotein carrier protein
VASEKFWCLHVTNKLHQKRHRERSVAIHGFVFIQPQRKRSVLKRFLLTVFLTAASIGGVSAGGLKSLENFVKTVKTGQADFTQVVTSPTREGQAPRVKTSSGRFEFSRPNRFRFDYAKPFVQTIVADGQTLWLYDVDLNQVTARKQAAVLGATPAALIASAADVRALQADFVLADAPDQDGLQWVLATPKSKDGQLQSVRVGFRTAGDGAAATSTLEVLEILDSFGQRSVLTFRQMKLNPALAVAAFAFKPPAGADLIRQ